MTRLHHAIGLAVAVAATIGIAWASNVRLTPHGRGEATLRLAWSARAERVEECRQQSEEELARLPVHMRQPLVCEGVSARYALEVRRNEVVIVSQEIQGGGLRHDRPLYVFHDLPQPAGDAAITVRFARVDTGTTAAAFSNSPDREGRLASDVPRSLLLDRRLNFRRGRVILVTYDPGRRELVAVEEGPR
jgi:hypothetical protein